MDLPAILVELEALAEKLDVQVVYDHFTGDGAGAGGLCKVKGQWRVIVERKASPGEKVSVLARALVRFDLEAHFISPAVRELLDRTTEEP
jgi:hypothetical protein